MGLFSFKSKEENAQLSALHNNYAVISFTPNGTILNANKNFLNALGYNISEIVGKHHKMFCDSSYTSSKAYEEFWEKLAKGETQTAEFKRIKKDGSTIFIQASYNPIKDSSGRVYEVIKFAQDITQKKLETLDYIGQLSAISKSQAVIEFNMDGTIIRANDNFLNTVGYSLNEIVGKHHSIFCEDSYKNSDEYAQFWKKLNNGNFDTGEYLRFGKNGKKVWISASYNPIFDIDGKPFKVVKYTSDITAKKNMMFEIGENIQNLTHSLNHLSSASQIMSENAKISMDGSSEVTVSIEQISQATSELSERIEAMLSSINAIANESSQGEKIAIEAREQSKATTNAMLELDKESEKIG